MKKIVAFGSVAVAVIVMIVSLFIGSDNSRIIRTITNIVASITGSESSTADSEGKQPKLSKRLINADEIASLLGHSLGSSVNVGDIEKILGSVGVHGNNGSYSYSDVVSGINKLKAKGEDISKIIKSLDSSQEKGSVIPKYNGDYNTVIGKSKFKTLPKKTKYYKLDEFGRPVGAETVITVKSFPKTNRKERPIDIDPVGWGKNFKVTVKHKDGSTYKGFFWNRSHIIADSFGGEVRIENLTTGTRAQNVGSRDNKGGMAYGETKVRNYLKANRDGKVYYKVKVHYKENSDIISDYSIVDIKSEDNAINERIIVYNEMEGFTIDRKNGITTKK